MKSFFIVPVLILTFLASAISAETLETPDLDLLKSGISFVPPLGWARKVEPDPDAKYVYWYGNPHGKAVMAISLPVPQNFLSFQYSLFYLRITQKPISEERTTIAGIPCYIFIYKRNDEQLGIVESKGYHFAKDGKAYFIYSMAPEKDFNKYSTVFEKAINSFSILSK